MIDKFSTLARFAGNAVVIVTYGELYSVVRHLGQDLGFTVLTSQLIEF